MKNKLTANLGLKIISILFAAVLWLLVTNINDPSVSQKFTNIPVKIQNADVITSQGKVYEVLEESDVIDVSVKAPRSIIDSINVENIVAVADMNDLTNVDTITIRLSTNKYNTKLESITASTESVKLNIENKKQISLAIRSTTSGTVEDGYMIGDVTLEQNQVRISGPESIVSRIDRAEADVTVTGFTSDIGTETEIKFYDEQGIEVPKTNVTRNIDNVRVNVEILGTKTVPLRFKYTGTPAAGFRASGVIESDPQQVLIAGKTNAINAVNAIDIPETMLNIDGLSESLAATIDYSPYLPENVELADGKGNTKANVIVQIEQESSRNIAVTEDIISAVNVPEGYAAKIATFEEEFTIQVVGLAADLAELNPAEIRGTVDVQKLMDNGTLGTLTEDYYDVSVEFNLPPNISLRRNITVRLTLEASDQAQQQNQEQAQVQE